MMFVISCFLFFLFFSLSLGSLVRFSSLCVPLNVVKTYLVKIDENLTGDDEQVIGDGADNQSIIGSSVVLICNDVIRSRYIQPVITNASVAFWPR